jgi:hypothetical protein
MAIISVPAICRETKFKIFQRIKYFFGIRTELSYENRIAWFFTNYYETGMEYAILLITMKNDDLDNLEWYDEYIKIPKYADEL